MKITQIAVFTSLMALSFNASAAGAKKPVTEFEGAYRLSAGTTYENQNGRDVACPESLTLDAEEVRNAKGKLVNATLKAASSSGTVMSFTKVNLGSTWLGGGNFNRAFSNKNSITAEVGREWMDPGTPRQPGLPGGYPGRSPELRRSIFYRYGFKQSGDTLKLWTSGSKDACVYNTSGAF